MRKNLFAIITISACALVACNKNEIERNTEPARTLEMTVVAGDVSTKTAFDGAGTSIIWSGTEKLKVFETVTGGTHNGDYNKYDSATGVSEDSGKTMTFGVSLSEVDGATSFVYNALYPHSAYYSTGTPSKTSTPVKTPYDQNPSADSFDPAADLLISQISDYKTSQPSSINMAFARKIAIGKMTLKKLGSSDDITSVSFSANQGETKVALAGSSVINFDESSVNYGANNKAYTISLDYEGDNVKVNSTEGAPIYFVCYPFSLNYENSGAFTVVVETETQRFTRTVTLADSQVLNFTAGNVSSFSVDMSGATVKTKAVSLHYAELTCDEVYAQGITNSTYKSFSLDKTHEDSWTGFVNKSSGGFGLRGTTAEKNDSYLKLPDFVEEISSVTVELATAISIPTDPSKSTPYLSLENASNVYSKTIAGIDAVALQTTYVFNVSESHIKTAYLRAVNNGAYVTKVSIVTKKTDSRTQLAAPTSVSASLSGTNDINVSWSKSTNAIGYEITCAPEAGANVVNIVGDVASYKVEGLADNTVYTISVAALPDPYTHTKSVAANASSTVETSAPALASFHYEKVTSTPSAGWAGTYILVCEETNKVFTGAISTTSTKYGLYDSVTISEGAIAGSDDLETYECTIAYNNTYTNAGYTICANSKYLFWSSGNSLNSGSSVSGQNNIWGIELDEGIIMISNLNTSGTAIRYIKFNSDRFACYTHTDGYNKTTGKGVHLYKRVED